MPYTETGLEVEKIDIARIILSLLSLEKLSLDSRKVQGKYLYAAIETCLKILKAGLTSLEYQYGL